MSTEITNQLFAILERAKHEALSLVVSLPVSEAAREPLPEWMTDVELARYWRIFNDDNEPVTAGIRSWAKRLPDQFPLPHAYMGDLLRFNRSEVDKWAKEESIRREAERQRRKPRRLSLEAPVRQPNPSAIRTGS
jgi:hypothetical protein